MFHYFDAITNTKGDALIGYYVKVVDTSTGSLVPLYADENSTPIFSVSGLANAAKVNSDGMADFYVHAGTYHLDIYATNGTTLAKRMQNVPMLTAADETVTIRPESFGATVYDPTNEVDSTAALQAFFDHAADPQNARAHVYDWSGEWMVRNTIYAAYWDGGEPNVERRFICGTLRVDVLANLPSAAPLAYVMEIAGLRQEWLGLLSVHETGPINQYANTTYATRRFKRGVHVRCFANSTMGDVAVDGARRDAVHFEGWEAGFTVNGITFSTANSIGAKFGRINGRYCGSSDHAGSNQAPAPITASARVQGKNTGTAYSAEVFDTDTTGQSLNDAQRTKITCGGGTTTAEIEINDLVWCRVELTAAIYGTIAANSGAGTITWSAGDPTNLDGSGNGLQVGELYPIFQGGENVGKVFRICSFGGTSNRTITVGVANPEDTYALVSHAATASASYVQYGTKSPHWVAQVIDSTHFTVSPWVPARMNSSFHVITGAAFKAEGDDISTVEVGPVHGLLCGTSLYTKGNFAPQYAAVLGESCGAAIRWGDPSYGGGQGLVIGGGHAEGNDFDLISGVYNGTGTINMQSYFDLSKCYGYTPHANFNDTELGVTRQLGSLQLFHQGMLIESGDAGGTFESRSGVTVVTNAPRLRKSYAHEQNPTYTIGADFDAARLFTKSHWAEIVWTATTGGAPGTMVLTLHSTLAGMGWAFAGEGSGSTYTISNPGKPVKLSLYYLFATKKVAIRRDQYFDVTLPLDFLNDVGLKGSLYIGKSSAGAFSNVDSKDLRVCNTTANAIRLAFNGATTDGYIQNTNFSGGFGDLYIQATNVRMDSGNLIVSGTVSGSNLTTGGFPASVATTTLVGRVAAGTGAASALTGTQAATIIDAATTSLQGAMSAQDKTRLNALPTWYRTLLDCSGYLTDADAAGTYGMAQGNKCAITGTGTLYPPNAIYIAAADFPAVGTLNPKLRIRATVHCNDVAPGVTFTIGLHPITRPATSGGAGVCIYTIGSAVASSTIALATPAADSSNVVVTAADFSLPSDGHYVIGVVTSGGALAASSHVHITTALQLRYA